MKNGYEYKYIDMNYTGNILKIETEYPLIRKLSDNEFLALSINSAGNIRYINIPYHEAKDLREYLDKIIDTYENLNGIIGEEYE